MHFLFEKRKPDKQLAVVEKVLSLFLFVEFEIICDSVGWMRVENAWIQTAGCAFRRADEEILGDFGAEFSKTKTLGAGVRIFNGAVRTEREFPLKILFLACIQGFVVLLILRNRDQNLPSRFLNTISVYSVSKYFRTFIPLHAADKFKILSKIVDKFRTAKYTIQVTCREQCPYRGLVKWYDRGLQNLWWEFDSLIPCSTKCWKP